MLILLETLLDWDPAHGFDSENFARSLQQHPNIWSAGSSVSDTVSGVSSAGSGMFLVSVGMPGKVGHGNLDHPRPGFGDRGEYCRAFCSVLGPLQTVQTAELWEVILVLIGTTRVTKVKGHADAETVLLVRLGRMAELVRIWRMRLLILDGGGSAVGLLMPGVFWLVFVGGDILWFSNCIGFFVAVARMVVSFDDTVGSAPDALVWSAGSLPKRRTTVQAVRDLASWSRLSLGFPVEEVYARM